MTGRSLRIRRGIRFSSQELTDLLIAWIALGLAFTFFLDQRIIAYLFSGLAGAAFGEFIRLMFLSLLTVGIGFLLHELAHKVVAIRFGQMAEFRADYGMLAIAIMAGLAGFLFAAPGAVYHQGRITKRQNGLIAVAGPMTNIGLVAVFLPLTALPGFLGAVGNLGVTINLLLAAFNMIPFGPLDGRKVLEWNRLVFAAVFVPSAVLSVARLLGLIFW